MTHAFEVLDSTSELAIRVHGASLEEIFKNALQAMFASMDPSFSEPHQEFSVDVQLTSQDVDQLLVDFLSEALFYADSKNVAFNDVAFHHFDPCLLSATLTGKKIERFALDLKAVTYHGALITEKDGKLSTDLLFDI